MRNGTLSTDISEINTGSLGVILTLLAGQAFAMGEHEFLLVS